MARKARPTLMEIAKTTGFSASTVSRALKTDPRVSPDTLATIQAAAEDVGFTQNSLASSLRSGGTAALIGLLVPDVQDPFFAAISSAIQSAATQEGREVLLGCHNDSAADQTRLVTQMISHRIEALVIAPATGPLPSVLVQEANYGTPLVVLDRPVPNMHCDAIITDNQAGARTLTKQLLARGHRRLLVASLHHDIWTMNERLVGVEDALAEAGCSLDPEHIVQMGLDGTISTEAIAAAFSSPEPPTAVLSLSIKPLMATLRVAYELGLRLEYACFDSNDFYDLLPVPVWCVNQNPAAIGQLAVERVLAQLDSGHPAPATISLPLSKLTKRGGAFNCE